MISKELFVECIKSLEKQYKIDCEFADTIAKAFPNCFAADLLPNTSTITSSFSKLLGEVTGDVKSDWITYFCSELDFGRENHRLKVYDNGVEIPLSTPEQLYDLLHYDKLNGHGV